jgi:hypothetical protein
MCVYLDVCVIFCYITSSEEDGYYLVLLCDVSLKYEVDGFLASLVCIVLVLCPLKATDDTHKTQWKPTKLYFQDMNR